MQTAKFLKLNIGRQFHTQYPIYSINSNNNGKSAKDVIKFLTGNTEKVGKTVNPKDNKIPLWRQRDETIKKKINGERWNPTKKLSRENMDSVRLLKKQMPHLTASDLGTHFKVSPDAIRRILKSKFRQTEEEAVKIQKRWERRGEMIKDLQKNNSLNGKNGEVNNEIIIRKKLKLTINSYNNSVETSQFQKHKGPKRNKKKRNKVIEDEMKFKKLALLSEIED